MLHFHFCPTAQCKKNHSNQNPHLISSCRSNGFALLHQRGLSRLSVDSLALHVGFLSQTQKPAINLALFPIPDRARPCSVSVSVSVSSSLELHGEQGSMWTRLHWTATLTSKAWTLQPRMWRTCCPPSHLMVRTVRTS